MYVPSPAEWPQLPRQPHTPHAKKGEARPVCGRKFCTCCGRWRLLLDFDVDKRSKRGVPIYWQPRCHTCHNSMRRIRLGTRRKEPGRAPREVVLARQKRFRDERRRDPERLEKKREYDRMWNEARRRRDGIPERRWGPEARRGDPTRERVSNVPIREALERSATTPTEVAAALGWLDHRGLADGDRVRRSVGLKLESDHRGQNFRQSIDIETAGLMIRALGLIPADFGL